MASHFGLPLIHCSAVARWLQKLVMMKPTRGNSSRSHARSSNYAARTIPGGGLVAKAAVAL